MATESNADTIQSYASFLRQMIVRARAAHADCAPRSHPLPPARLTARPRRTTSATTSTWCVFLRARRARARRSLAPPPRPRSQLIKNLETRFYININDLRTFKPDLAAKLMREPVVHVPLLEKAITDAVTEEKPDFFALVAAHERKAASTDAKAARIAVGIEGNFGASTVSPRTLAAHFLSQLVKLEGIVTKVRAVGQRAALGGGGDCARPLRALAPATSSSRLRILSSPLSSRRSRSCTRS